MGFIFQMKTNFYKFINKFRVEKFKRLVESGDASKYTIMGLAHKAGFNSKSSFYEAFKLIEGTTPLQYLKNLES